MIHSEHTGLYLQATNPVHVWRAYVARRCRVPIPDWVLAYFDTVAKGLAAPTCGATHATYPRAQIAGRERHPLSRERRS